MRLFDLVCRALWAQDQARSKITIMQMTPVDWVAESKLLLEELATMSV
jgi:hypothetical protein